MAELTPRMKELVQPYLAVCQVGNDTHIWRDLSGGADEAKLDRDAAESVKFLRAAFGE